MESKHAIARIGLRRLRRCFLFDSTRMHTLKVIVGGLLLLAVCLLAGRWLGATPAAGMATAVKVFVPLWFVAAAINLWVGVKHAGYSFAEEAPVFGIVFAVPVAFALLVWWIGRR
jgi:hypothetical protein